MNNVSSVPSVLIKAIDGDARVHFMPYAMDVMQEVLGFECASFTSRECEELAREQMSRFGALERRYLP